MRNLNDFVSKKSTIETEKNIKNILESSIVIESDDKILEKDSNIVILEETEKEIEDFYRKKFLFEKLEMLKLVEGLMFNRDFSKLNVMIQDIKNEIDGVKKED